MPELGILTEASILSIETTDKDAEFVGEYDAPLPCLPGVRGLRQVDGASPTHQVLTLFPFAVTSITNNTLVTERLGTDYSMSRQAMTRPALSERPRHARPGSQPLPVDSDGQSFATFYTHNRVLRPIMVVS